MAKAPALAFQGRHPLPQLDSTPLQSVVPALPSGKDLRGAVHERELAFR